MIKNPSLCWSSLRQTALIAKSPCFIYVKQKEIDIISEDYGESNWETIKKYGVIFKHICLEGFKGFRADLKLYKQLMQKQTHSLEETKEKMRIFNDISKMGPLIIIQILPFSGPLFMLYMYTYPGSIPSWFMIDFYHDRHNELKVRNQQKSMEYFQQRNFTAEQINLDSLSLREMRKISMLLFGIYRDGTIGYRKLTNRKIDHLFSEGLSKWLIKRQLSKRFKNDLLNCEQTDKMESLQDMVRWKFQRVMSGQEKIVFTPMYEQSPEKISKNEGKQSRIYQQIDQEEQISEEQSKGKEQVKNSSRNSNQK